jgi:hypothetical protein
MLEQKTNMMRRVQITLAQNAYFLAGLVLNNIKR